MRRIVGLALGFALLAILAPSFAVAGPADRCWQQALKLYPSIENNGWSVPKWKTFCDEQAARLTKAGMAIFGDTAKAEEYAARFIECQMVKDAEAIQNHPGDKDGVLKLPDAVEALSDAERARLNTEFCNEKTVEAMRKEIQPVHSQLELAKFWQGCTAEVAAGQVLAECAEASVELTFDEITTAAADRAELRASSLNVYVRLLGGELEVRAITPFALQVAEADGRRLSLATDEEASTMFIAAVSKGPQEIWLITCEDDRPDEATPACPTLIDAIGAHGIPEVWGVKRVSLEPTFVDRRLQIPPGCSTNTGEDIRCPLEGSDLWWETIDPAQPEAFDATVEAGLKEMEDLSRWRLLPTAVECQIEQTRARCERYELRVKGQRLLFVKARAKVRGVEVGVACSYISKPGEPELSPVCAQILTLDQ